MPSTSIVAFVILDDWGEVGAVVINLVGFASILTLIAAIALLLRGARN